MSYESDRGARSPEEAEAMDGADAGTTRAARVELGSHHELGVLSFRLADAQLPELTSAERDVCHRLLAGASNADIADARGTSVRTVANQVASIFRKLDCSSRAELVSRLGGARREASGASTDWTPTTTADSSIAVVEAAYAVGGSHSDWLTRMLLAARPLLWQGEGLAAFRFDASDATRFQSHDIVVLEGGTALADTILKAHRQLTPPMTEAIFRKGPGLSTLCAKLGISSFTEHPYMAASDSVRVLKEDDQIGLCASDTSHQGVVLVGSSSRVLEAPSPRLVSRWSRVAGHISAALRLRLRLHALLDASPVPATEVLADGAEAVLTPDGRCVHATGEASSKTARALLRTACQHVDTARSTARRDPDAALDLWQGLVSGRWSLVDTWDSDQRRFLVARRNEPDCIDPRRLTTRERQVASYVGLGMPSKEIAWHLGLAEPTINAHVRRAVQKLGVGNRAELAALVREFG